MTQNIDCTYILSSYWAHKSLHYYMRTNSSYEIPKCTAAEFGKDALNFRKIITWKLTGKHVWQQI